MSNGMAVLIMFASLWASVFVAHGAANAFAVCLAVFLLMPFYPSGA